MKLVYRQARANVGSEPERDDRRGDFVAMRARGDRLAGRTDA